MPVTAERHGQCGRHIQRLDNIPGLSMIEHVHDIAVPEGMERHWNEKCTRQLRLASRLASVSSAWFHRLLSTMVRAAGVGW